MAGCSPASLQAVLSLTGDAKAADAICSGGTVKEGLEVQSALTWMVAKLQQAEAMNLETRKGLDVNFILQSAYGVFIMQLGFALFAAGVVKPKNVVSIFIKNFVDTCVAGIVFYIFGYAFYNGVRPGYSMNGFIGQWDFALSYTDSQKPTSMWELFVWNWSFCSAATTILSGSIAERGTFLAYLCYAVVMTGWIYPVEAHWLWSPAGWLSIKNELGNRILGVGAIDYAGSGVVHLTGGIASLVGSYFVGARVGRFDSEQLSMQLYRATASPQLYLMGTFLLWFGWYGFNPGSRLGIGTYAQMATVGRTAVCTTLAGSSGALTSLWFNYKRHHTFDLLSTCVGALAGLVAVTAGCSVLQPWAAIICGIIASPVYELGEYLLERYKIDDPVSAFPLHGMCGLWGLLYVGLMADEGYIFEVYHLAKGNNRMGLFYGGHAQLLLCQFITCLVITAWSGFWIGLTFWLLSKAGKLRVDKDKEAAGIDMAACGQFNAPGAVNVNSSKITTPGNGTDFSWRAKSAPQSFDPSVRPPGVFGNGGGAGGGGGAVATGSGTATGANSADPSVRTADGISVKGGSVALMSIMTVKPSGPTTSASASVQMVAHAGSSGGGAGGSGGAVSAVAAVADSQAKHLPESQLPAVSQA